MWPLVYFYFFSWCNLTQCEVLPDNTKMWLVNKPAACWRACFVSATEISLCSLHHSCRASRGIDRTVVHLKCLIRLVVSFSTRRLSLPQCIVGSFLLDHKGCPYITCFSDQTLLVEALTSLTQCLFKTAWDSLHTSHQSMTETLFIFTDCALPECLT